MAMLTGEEALPWQKKLFEKGNHWTDQRNNAD
jgi:hypothetical protein